jgi:hypothetical protein
VVSGGRELQRRYGDPFQRVIHHYWFHTGENAAIRQALGRTKPPQFVGSIDSKAPYRPDRWLISQTPRAPRSAAG